MANPIPATIHAGVAVVAILALGGGRDMAGAAPRPGHARALEGAATATAPGSLRRESPPAVTVCNAVWHDAARGRDVPVRIRMPAGEGRVPVILFSHGLGGSLDAGTTWAEAWAANGFAVVHLQHPGSDAALWQGKRRPAQILAALRSGMTAQQLVARAGDVHFVLDELARRRREGRCDLTRLDMTRVGMAGHSFGAHTAQAVAGQSFPGAGGAAPRPELRDERVRAAIAFSPAPPSAPDAAVRAAFATIAIPFFSITGTEDQVPLLTRVTPEQRTVPYRDMPPGGKYLLVLAGADHAALSGNVRDVPAGVRAGRTGRAEGRALGRATGRAGAAVVPQAHVERVVVAATVAFWKATLLGDPAARAFLAGNGLRALLAPGDRFARK